MYFIYLQNKDTFCLSDETKVYDTLSYNKKIDFINFVKVSYNSVIVNIDNSFYKISIDNHKLSINKYEHYTYRYRIEENNNLLYRNIITKDHIIKLWLNETVAFTERDGYDEVIATNRADKQQIYVIRDKKIEICKINIPYTIMTYYGDYFYYSYKKHLYKRHLYSVKTKKLKPVKNVNSIVAINYGIVDAYNSVVKKCLYVHLPKNLVGYIGKFIV